jgi:hypothetical protein
MRKLGGATDHSPAIGPSWPNLNGAVR